jgi:precorrin-2 dehydrogenase/sirohydrochlorin ferrochelatase
VKYFPVFLNLRGKRCVVVGGGRVGERKVRILLKAGARLKVVGPELTSSLLRLREKGRIHHFARPYRQGDLAGAFLAIAATDDRRTNERIFRQATDKKILVNVVDDPDHSSFIVPSIVKKQDLLVAISTSGRSPALARMLRQRLEKEIGPEYSILLELLGRAREKVLSLGRGRKENQRTFRRFVQEDLLSLIRDRRFQELNDLLQAKLGSAFSLKELGLRW